MTPPYDIHYNFLVDFNYNDIVAEFAKLIFNNCHNLKLWSSVPEFAKTGYNQSFVLPRTYAAKGREYLNPGPDPTHTWRLVKNGISKSSSTLEDIKKDIKKYSVTLNDSTFSSLQPYSENIIYFVSYLLLYCYSHLRFHRQVYEATYGTIYPCTFLVYSKTAAKDIPTHNQLKILANTTNIAEVFHAVTEVVNQPFDWNPLFALSDHKTDEYGAYKAIFEKIKQQINVVNIIYTIQTSPGDGRLQ